MSNANVQVVTRICAKPACQEELQALLMKYIEPIRNQPGCLTYDVFQNEKNSTEFVCLETWANDAVLNTHRDLPSTHDIHKELTPLLAEPIDIRRYQQPISVA